ncbi:hypothetical protein SAMN05216243_1226 [Sediminibacillus albus]|uniref:Uncharacterized protein n=1 Tax=Sediminibacillus albus TaxID=407036 RepID=A0A1G8X8Q4_9BACI|nr:hypothetical protein SAMN05216243_1226 [Sediminibacillus albus]
MLTAIAFLFNLFGILRLVPLYFTMPILFISIYLTIFSFAYKNTFRGFSKISRRL